MAIITIETDSGTTITTKITHTKGMNLLQLIRKAVRDAEIIEIEHSVHECIKRIVVG